MTPRRRSAPLPAVQLLTPLQVEELIGVSRRTLREWRYMERGPAYVVLEGRIRYRSDDLEHYLNAQRVEPA